MLPYRRFIAAVLMLGLTVLALPGPAHADYYYDRYHHRHYRPPPRRYYYDRFHHRHYYR